MYGALFGGLFGWLAFLIFLSYPICAGVKWLAMRIRLSASGEWQEEREYYKQIGAGDKTLRWYHDPNWREEKRQSDEWEVERQKRQQWEEEEKKSKAFLRRQEELAKERREYIRQLNS